MSIRISSRMYTYSSPYSYLTRYSAMIVISMAIAVFFVVWFLYGSIKASRIIHQKLVRSVLGTTLR